MPMFYSQNLNTTATMTEQKNLLLSDYFVYIDDPYNARLESPLIVTMETISSIRVLVFMI